MAGSSFGTIFRLTTWGESHGKGVGVVVDGVPAGLSLSEEDIQFYLDRRKPGQNRFTTKRKESDTVQILSGTFEGKRPVPRFPWWYGMRISIPKITATLLPITDRATPTIRLMQNTVSATTAAADAPQDARRSHAWLQVPLP